MKRSTNIGRRILIVMLIAALGMGVVLSIFTFNRITNIYKEAEKTQDELSSIAETTIKTTLTDSIEQSIYYWVINNTSSIERQLIQTEYQVDLLADAMSIQPDWTSQESKQIMQAMMESIAEHESTSRMVKFTSTSGIRIHIPDRIVDSKFDTLQRAWYRKLKEDDVVSWSDAIEDSKGNKIVTCAESFSNDNNEKGFISIELPVDELFANDSISIQDASSAGIVVFNKKGACIYSSSQDISAANMQEITALFNSVKTSLDDDDDDDESDDGSDTATSLPKAYIDSNDNYYIACTPISKTEWYYLIYVEKTLISTPTDEMLDSFKTLTEAADTRMSKSKNTAHLIFSLAFIACAALVVFFSRQMAKHIRQPLQEMATKAFEMGKGNLAVRMNTNGDEEIAELGTAFNTMADDLQKYISQVQLNAQEQEKRHTEMQVAHAIQTGLLPMTFPAFPDDPRFDIYASMRTAREVGGDFYDFFKPDPDHLVMVIADVSGKGIPAALFMVVARTLIQDHIDPDASVATLFEDVNNRITKYNPAEMFVTAWIGIIDLNTGIMRCANAGHEYPIVKTAVDKPFELIHDQHGLVLGGMENVHYHEYTLQIQPGGSIVLYTDGVTEQHNGHDELFGEARTVETINAVKENTPRAIIEGVQNAVDVYKNSAPQFDDMTLMCWKRLI